ncbi:XrtN system VIT domain-containing protein [Chitinophaga caseinilytica]|uniref:XrtN system VIT domain-containing protein n=1 Tax=Chitinophaga caseinilytica TaxID=2267521 RepID=A0ABZ2YY97_9BACT
MENSLSLQQRLTDHRYLGFFSLLVFSLFSFFIGNTFDLDGDETWFSLFLIHAGLAILCLIGYITLKKDYPFKKDVGTIILLLALISCYALNREMDIFMESVPWMAVLLLISGAALLLLRYADLMPRWARVLLGFTTGISSVLFAYLAIYLIPLYGIAIAGILMLGIGLHAFVPAFLLYHTISAIRSLKLGKPALAGAVLSLIIIVVFCVKYAAVVNDINRVYNRKTVEGKDDLPAWVETSRQVVPGFVADRVLKTGLIYSSPELRNDVFGYGMFMRDRMGSCHDPLVTTAQLFAQELAPDKTDRYKILEALYDGRHDQQDRLWSGDDLSTRYIHTQIQLWPEQHLAYTEKSLTVFNQSNWRTEEGIYSFELPEGGVVTSLSLWINGKEEKAVLTTKEKADSAYKTIVGREARDPSLVRWQEGNIVSVRVFPVNPQDKRVFKIGVTAPLKSENGKMVYENIAFKGPDFRSATEFISIGNLGQKLLARKPAGFDRTEGRLEREGAYRPNWRLEMEDTPLRPSTFTFNGNAYTIMPYETQRSTVATSAIYLDINHAWTYGDVRRIIDMSANLPVRVFSNGQFTDLPKNNFQAYIAPLQRHRFSLFPFHRLPDPAGALVVIKSAETSPMLSDLEGSAFRQKLSEKLADPQFPKIRLYDFGGRFSPYLASLRASRAFRYEKGTQEQLRELLNKGIFADDPETPDRVVIHEAKAAIVRQADSAAAGTGPDHLMRLFAYNHILQQTGKGLITGSEGQENLIAEAKEAYVVSPISSLVVLETKQDYERFDIKDSGNSLRNAALNDSGSVPEPHEWALIIIAILSVYLYLNRRRWTVFNA